MTARAVRYSKVSWSRPLKSDLMKYLVPLILFFILLPVYGLGQGAPPFTLQEIDGSPRVLAPTAIKVTNGSLSCNGKTCTITIGSGSGTVTSVSVTTANGVSGSVANATTTPAITLTLGAITPTSVAINGGATVTKVLSATASLDFGATAAGTCDSLTITVTGAADGDVVSLGIPNALASSDTYQSFNGFVSATNTVTVKRCNLLNLVTPLSNPAAATVRATVIQH